MIPTRPRTSVLVVLSTVTTCDESHGLAFNDWIPVNAETWERIEQLRLRE